MSITIFRLDERLIHGQVMTSWIGYSGATEIAVVDDKIAKDDFMKMVLVQAAPKNINLTVLTSEDFNSYKQDNDSKNKIILFKNLDCVINVLELGGDIEELCLGNMGSSPGRKKYAKSIYMTDEEREKISLIEKNGCEVVMQMLPNETKKKL